MLRWHGRHTHGEGEHTNTIVISIFSFCFGFNFQFEICSVLVRTRRDQLKITDWISRWQPTRVDPLERLLLRNLGDQVCIVHVFSTQFDVIIIATNCVSSIYRSMACASNSLNSAFFPILIDMFSMDFHHQSMQIGNVIRDEWSLQNTHERKLQRLACPCACVPTKTTFFFFLIKLLLKLSETAF